MKSTKSSIQVFKCSSVQVFKCSSLQVFQYSSIPVFQYSSILVLKYSSNQVFKYRVYKLATHPPTNQPINNVKSRDPIGSENINGHGDSVLVGMCAGL